MLSPYFKIIPNNFSHDLQVSFKLKPSIAILGMTIA